jgi:hypothetical protein
MKILLDEQLPVKASALQGFLVPFVGNQRQQEEKLQYRNATKKIITS